MANRRLNPRLAKIHRSYAVEEVAQLFGVHRNTVRQWVKQGLPVVDDKRPMLILGEELGAFLTNRRSRSKRPCGPGEVYCMRCRVPRSPALGMADYVPVTETSGNLAGLCPDCGAMMYRRVSLAKLTAAGGDLKVRILERAGEGSSGDGGLEGISRERQPLRKL